MDSVDSAALPPSLGGGGTTSAPLGAAVPASSVAAAAGGSSSSGTHLTIEGKVILVGDSNCGKTSIVAVFARGETGAATRPSIGCSYSKQSVSVPGCTVNFSVWDTAGTEKFRSVNTLYYRGCVSRRRAPEHVTSCSPRGAHHVRGVRCALHLLDLFVLFSSCSAAAAVIVFDVTNRASFANVRQWVDEVRKYTALHLVVCLVGNKADLKAQRQVTPEEGASLATSLGAIAYQETSARTGTGVLDAFRAIAREAPRLAHPAAPALDLSGAGAASGGAGAPTSAPSALSRIEGPGRPAASSSGAADGFRIVAVEKAVEDWDGLAGGKDGKAARKSRCC